MSDANPAKFKTLVTLLGERFQLDQMNVQIKEAAFLPVCWSARYDLNIPFCAGKHCSV